MQDWGGVLTEILPYNRVNSKIVCKIFQVAYGLKAVKEVNIMKKLASLCSCLALSLSLGMATLAPATPAVAAPREKVILDADMVDLFDDGVAMMMLADSPKVDLKGVSIVIGNTWVETGTASAIRQLEGFKRSDIPVYMGVNKVTREGRFEQIKAEKKKFGRGFDSHLGAIGYAKPDSWQTEYRKNYKAEPVMQPQKQAAPDFIIDTVKKYPNQVTIVAIGSAANLAAALEKAPEIANLAKRVVYMAGAFFVEGNVMPTAEFNVWIDPETAKKVYRAPWKEQIFLPLDVCSKELMTQKDFVNLENRIKTKRFKDMWENHYATPLFRNYPSFQNFIWDVLAAAVAIDPSVILESETLPIDVDDQFGLGYGQTLAFRGYGPEGAQNAKIVYKVDHDKIWRMIEKVFDKL